MTMRHPKGYMLNELILILTMISLIMLLSVTPVRLFFRSVLGTHEAFERQGQLERLLDQLGADTEAAALATVHAGDARLGGDLLYLSGPEGVVCYQFSDGAATCIRGSQMQEWTLPQATFEWRVLTLAGGGQAVAMTTQQTHPRRGDGLPVFRGSRVFVVNLNQTLQITERP
jgi:type II secretory pathway component PulJ